MTIKNILDLKARSSPATSPPERQGAPKIHKKIKMNKFLKIFLVIFSSLLIVFVAIGIFAYISFYIPGKDLYTYVLSVVSRKDEIMAIVSSKNIAAIKVEIDKLNQNLIEIDQKYKKLSFASKIPYAKDYYNDGIEIIDISKQSLETGKIVLDAIEPFQDFLGLQGTATDSAKTTEDRISFLVDSAESLVPKLGDLETKIKSIETSIKKINPSRYPEEFKGIKIHKTYSKVLSVVDEISTFVKEGKPLLEKTSWLLGKETPRNFFVLFQNDGELRPSGGFWTAYGILKVNNGKIEPVISADIYSLDEKLNSTIPAPRPIRTYHINVPYWHLRDMNISPDFPTNINTFLTHYKKINPKDKFDAIIAIDTQVLVDLVRIIGRIGVPGWGNFSADPDKRCDGCPQIIYQLEYIAGKPKSYIDTNRKGFLAPLMHSILANAMGSPKEKLAPLAESMIKNLNQKHILFYFLDEEIQKAAENANIAGTIVETDSNTDYFHLNDSNMSSAKTNIFLKQEIKHEIISQNSQVSHKISVTYKNPSKASNCNLEKGDLCLNAPKYRNWFRYYVPMGSLLEKMTGSEVEPLKYEELGKQVFEGFYGDKYPLYAESSLKTSIQYTSSVKPSSSYKILLQKQPGTKSVKYELFVNGKEYDTFYWTSDKIINISL